MHENELLWIFHLTIFFHEKKLGEQRNSVSLFLRGKWQSIVIMTIHEITRICATDHGGDEADITGHFKERIDKTQ